MKKSLRSLAALLALLLLLASALAALTACDNGGGTESSESETESNSEAQTDSTTPGAQKKSYTVSIKSLGGRPFANLSFRVCNANDLSDLIEVGETDENGIGTVDLDPNGSYAVTLPANKLEGYKLEESYPISGNSVSIMLSSEIIADSDLTGVKYTLGSVMHDFTVTDTDGTTFTLSEVLKTKKAVMINFWYSTCGPCVSEFPYLQSAYEKYKDDIEVIALNHYPTDDETKVKEFKASMGLTFPVAKDYTQLVSAFNVQNYPTSIFIDRYGTVCLIEVGALPSEKPFVAAFSHFAAADYQQRLIENLEELTPAERPNVSMPDSETIGAALNGTGFSAEYAPETNTSDAEYSWPFLVGERDGKPCVYASNANKDASFATLHATVEMKAGEALAVEWYAETERGVDILYVLIDDRDIYRLSGISTEWQTCYPYVALEDGTHKLSFIYLKDGTTDEGADTVYLRNLHTVSEDAVNVDTYIPRDAATKPHENGAGYQHYVTPVFNPTDGFYHVGTAEGPLLLVDLMAGTKLSETALNDLGYNGELVYGEADLYETLVDYCNFAINGTIYGHSPVTEELKGILEKAAELHGFGADTEPKWLQACMYYDAYGKDVEQLASPIKGLAPFDPFIAVESEGVSDTLNTVTYDGRVIMPRGFLYKFVPSKSGAYIIKSQSDKEVNGWFFNENREILLEASIVNRPYDGKPLDTQNVTMIVYMEADKTYFIDIAYYDVYAEGSFTFTLRYLGESYQQFHLASPGFFTYTENSSGQLNETVAGGIDVMLGADGYYYEKRADGTQGSLIYADFTFETALFDRSIEEMIGIAGFDFSKNEYDDIVLKRLALLNNDVNACREFFRNQWQDQYDEFAAEYKLEEILAGKLHGPDGDCTEEIRGYLAKKLPKTDEAPELEGCVPVDTRLAEILQMLVDKYSFSGVDHAWTKLCYYYKNVGP